MPWLMKAEPDSRIVKGKDVKFSVDDFQRVRVTQWDGVRNHVARNFMKDFMQVGDKVLFYHSNCKEPGVYAMAEVAKAGYPDYTAWDPEHPYFDPKTDKENPTWFMVDVRFVCRLRHPVPLALIKLLAAAPSLPHEVDYLEKVCHEGLKNMVLVRQVRLSVQPVRDEAYAAIVFLGANGGWEGLLDSGKGKKEKRPAEAEAEPQDLSAAKPSKSRRVDPTSPQSKALGKPQAGAADKPTSRESTGSRRSTRVKDKA